MVLYSHELIHLFLLSLDEYHLRPVKELYQFLLKKRKVVFKLD